jgi:hypothetical protein
VGGYRKRVTGEGEELVVVVVIEGYNQPKLWLGHVQARSGKRYRRERGKKGIRVGGGGKRGEGERRGRW